MNAKPNYIDETEIELEFGNSSRHVDIRFGILNHGVLDKYERQTHLNIRLGVIGSASTNESFLNWMQECAGGVEAKESNKFNLFPAFPGFGHDSPFSAELTCHKRSQRELDLKSISKLSKLNTSGEIVRGATEIYAQEIDYLVNETKPDVICCLIPDSVIDQLDRAASLAPSKPLDITDADDAKVDQYRHDFHHFLKARAMMYRTPLQLILPSTFGMGVRRKSTKKKSRKALPPRQLQDPATRAWNLFTALYYKAGGVPWRMPRSSTDYATCYIGISFYKSLDESSVMTSIAQVFNERGQGIVVRGGLAQLSKVDRTPHLSEDDSQIILANALKRYRDEHKNLPARVVIHKTSSYSPDEIMGFNCALDNCGISMADMLSLRTSNIRLFRKGQYPVMRGTNIELDEQTHLLFTRGSIPFYETYPGMYAPRGIEIKCDKTERSRESICKDILSLTKMNWNNTQFDMRDPITTRAAKRVGDIMKYIPSTASSDEIALRYSFYM